MVKLPGHTEHTSLEKWPLYYWLLVRIGPNCNPPSSKLIQKEL